MQILAQILRENQIQRIREYFKESSVEVQSSNICIELEYARIQGKSQTIINK